VQALQAIRARAGIAPMWPLTRVRPAMAPVTVLFTTLYGERLGGSEQVLWMFLSRVDRTRIEPFVIFHRDGGFVADVARLDIETTVIATGRFRQLARAAGAVRRQAKVMRAVRPDVIAHWLAPAQVYGAPAAMLAGMGARSMWFQRHLVDGSDLADRLATRLPARAIGTPSAGAARAQATRLRPSRRTFWVHNGIDVPPPAPPGRLEQLRARHAIPAGVPVVGMVARIQRWKGQHRLLAALALLRERGVAVHGVLVGGTQHGEHEDYAQEIEDLVDELRLREHVTFTGQVDDASDYYELFDVAVNASDEESFGLVVVEAMMRGTAVVAVDHGGPAEIIDHGRTGVLVAHATGEALADGIAWLLADQARRAAIAAAGRAEARSRFTVDRMVEELTCCFETLARGELPGQPGSDTPAAA